MLGAPPRNDGRPVPTMLDEAPPRRRLRLTIAEAMGVIACVALALRWPPLGVSVGIWLTIAGLRRAGLVADSVVGSVEGWLALVVFAWEVFAPAFFVPSDPVVLAILIGNAFGFALGGVRFARGGGRVAAWIALGFLSLLLLLVIVTSISRWEQVVWYWHNYS